jgi:hypothetical protein
MFDLDSYPTPAASEIVAAFERVWRSVGHPGACWSGEERVAIARIGRAGREGGGSGSLTMTDVGLPPTVVQASTVLGGDPGRIRAPWVDALYEAGLGGEAYVEIISIVSRVTVVDTFHRALGLPLVSLPDPESGGPTGEIDERARRTSRTFAPTVGPPTIPTSLSAIPAEMGAMVDLGDTMYMTGEDMADPDFERDGLHRTQIELVATGTSRSNDCFY